MNTHRAFLTVILLLAADAATNTSLVADLSASASLTGPSTTWLAGAGQSAEWRAATQPGESPTARQPVRGEQVRSDK